MNNSFDVRPGVLLIRAFPPLKGKMPLWVYQNFFFLPPGWFPDNILRTPELIDLKLCRHLTWVNGLRPIDFGPDQVID